ncbi:glycosyltransferase family 4 protein [Luteolibacter flavescens]|uniref:Glycosyltransferase family 4 protein n=1 Tax=Luteolibacter flavescens TaxID=1859460 RepID=A0ABT3FUP6_9BACT|nr:glycosyltransferase family 4 protein [Luteolibacter flavescens]MCW1887315.1 glycosyltransferase family 4 protein [Luteolibacter flavescens]
MTTSRKFVAAFAGRRDGYQVPLALAESNTLEKFLTGLYLRRSDAWANRLPEKIRGKFESRVCDGLPDQLVQPSLRIELMQHLSRIVGDPTNRSWQWANRAISVAARGAARRSRSDLLLYEPYAWEAFTADYSHRPRKVLFHFHLHPVFERDLTEQQEKAHSLGITNWLATDARQEDDNRVIDAWRHSDLVICASSFTKRSLTSQGLAPERCIVVPYGIDVPPDDMDVPVPDGFSVLFVGSGIRRKGLHHLLNAWSRANLPKRSSLTLVCRSLDPALVPLLGEMPPNVRLLRGASASELKELYQKSSLFAMPSLVEGFGQVYLEALSAGCPVLGTPNTCLPDLGSEEDGIFICDAGDVASLQSRLETLSETLTRPDSDRLRTRAKEIARRHSWRRFRQGINDAISTHLPE